MTPAKRRIEIISSTINAINPSGSVIRITHSAASYKDIDLFVGINETLSENGTKDVILKYHHDSLSFEATFTYNGKAGSLKTYASPNNASHSTVEIKSFMVR